MKKKKDKELNYVICPFCGYNNEFYRFQSHGTCLRCHKIVDQKTYIKRRLWEANHRRKLLEEDYYG